MPVYTIGCPKPRLGVSENGVYGLSPFKWQRINEEHDHNPMDLGLHYCQANHEKYHEIYHQFNMWQPQKRLPTSTVYCKWCWPSGMANGEREREYSVSVCIYIYIMYTYIYIHIVYWCLFYLYVYICVCVWLCVCIYMCNFSAPLSNTVRRLRIPSARPFLKSRWSRWGTFRNHPTGMESFRTSGFILGKSSGQENNRSLCISNTWNWKVIMFFWHYPLLFSWCQLNQVCCGYVGSCSMQHGNGQSTI